MERVVDPLVLQRRRETNVSFAVGFAIMVALFVVLPFIAYPVFLMQALCFALFACAFNLLIGYVGLVSFGHALYFGWASYLACLCRQGLGLCFRRKSRSSSAPRPRPCSASSPAASPSAARASISP